MKVQGDFLGPTRSTDKATVMSSFLETVIITKIKCAGSFDLLFALLVIIYLA